MKTTLFLLFTSAWLLTACNKSGSGTSSSDSGQAGSHTGSDLDELMKLPDAEKKMDLWVYSKTQTISDEAFEIASPQVVVKRINKDLFEVRAVYSATATSDLYSAHIPEPVSAEGKAMSYTVTELLARKGTKKARFFQCQVRYGPMNWGREPEKVQWNWENPKESGDDMKIYELGGPRGWATAEAFGINAEGTASTNPEILIRGTPDYLKTVEKHPQLATIGGQRQQEEAERFDRILEVLPRKSR